MICLVQKKLPHLGEMLIGATDKGICLFDFQYRHKLPGIMKRITALTGWVYTEAAHPYHQLITDQIMEYLNGTRTQFELPLHLVGTPFQVQVWEALLQIPYGQTRSYKQQSQVLNNEKAIRAVAHANGENSLAIVVPCHRVIGEDGSLTGYGGGLPRKKWLLAHERSNSGIAVQGSLF